MRSSIRLISRVAFWGAVSAAQLTGCFSHSSSSQEEPDLRGKVSLNLMATAQTGATFRLRNAFFVITDIRTGEQADFLFSESLPDTVSELSTVLRTGNYTMTLQPGWFMERISSGPSGSGGASSQGGSIGVAGFPSKGGAPSFGGVTSEGGADGELAGAPPIDPAPSGGRDIGSGGKASSGGFAPGGFGPGGESFGGFTGEPGIPQSVDAQLVDDAVKFFSIFGNDDVFLSFRFRIGGDVVDFTRGRVHVGIEVDDQSVECIPPVGALREERVLLERNVNAVAQISLTNVFDALVSNEGGGGEPLDLYHELIDSYASASNARMPNAVHCGDETTNGEASLNGYPIVCDRVEANQFDNVEAFFATSFVNRIDLAPLNGAHCGQQRITFANNSQNRMFLIFENQIPNPAPELGLKGCAPIAQFWSDANSISNPVERGQRLARAFLIGDPDLAAAGFGPFVSAGNLTAGSGQIRANSFDQDPWTLREFKLTTDGESLRVIPFPVGEAPNGQLWNDEVDLPAGEACRQNFIDAVPQLLSDDPAEMSFVIADACRDSESRNDFAQAYPFQMSEGFRQRLAEALAPVTNLSADDIATRAQFAGSCIGCHEEATGSFLGNGVFAPFSNSFVHIQEFGVQCPNPAEGTCFQASPALTQVFLPRRMRALADILGIVVPVDPCSGGGSGGRGGVGGATSTGRGGAGPVSSGGASQTGSAGAVAIPADEPAPVVVIELPPSDTPVDELQALDTEIRTAYGARTLGGRSAQVTH